MSVCHNRPGSRQVQAPTIGEDPRWSVHATGNAKASGTRADVYPRDSSGFPIGNYLEIDERARPRFNSPASGAFDSEGRPVILVIGAGYVGVSAALRLAELKRESEIPARIVLVDAGRVASGPSGKSAGHICGLQLPENAVRRHCGRVLGDRLIAVAMDAADLVRSLIARYEIPCDLRDGYIVIHKNHQQTLKEGGNEFGIDPYPFVLGLACAAWEMGIEIYEGTKVTGIEERPDSCLVFTTNGVIRASLILAAAGHQMAEDIPLLASLRSQTTELRVTTIITDPLPESVLRSIMPQSNARRYPFGHDAAGNVAYGSIDRRNRLVFGACATAWRDPVPQRIARVLTELLPSLACDYREATGRELGWQPLVVAERLCFTRELLPNVGSVAGHHRVHYVQALGGHGIALGTTLGRAAAEKLWGIHSGHQEMGAVFDTFAAVEHGWLPPWQPWRNAAAGIGLFLHSLGRNSDSAGVWSPKLC